MLIAPHPALLLIALLALAATRGLASPELEAGYDAFERGDVDYAVQIWSALAEQGDTTAQFNLGQLYRMGKGVARNDQEAVKWYSRAARGGSESAKYNLILMHSEGRATRDELDMAFTLSRAPAPRAIGVTPESGWFAQLPRPQYVLQLVSSPHKRVLERYAREKLPDIPAAPQIVLTMREGRPHYVLLLGPYESRQQGRQALAGLPAEVKADQPWVRPAASVQQNARRQTPAVNAAEDWFWQLPTQQYVLQLVTSPYRKSLERYASRHLGDVGMSSDIVLTDHRGKDNYLLLLGPFDSRQQASDMIHALPVAVRENKPYARSVISVQRVVKSPS